MRHELVVPDASVILKWAFNAVPGEKDIDRADILLHGWLNGKYEIVLPGLWVFEVANVLGLKIPDLAGEFMDAFMDYRFKTVTMTHDLCREAFKIMRKYRVTFYDSIYHAVALKNSGLLVTADETYYKKVRAAGSMILLRDFSPEP